MYLLRPGAKWEFDGQKFTRWEDYRPCPTVQELYETIDKIKAFEDSINTIYTEKQLEDMGVRNAQIKEAIGDN
jgi:hypothetical protein